MKNVFWKYKFLRRIGGLSTTILQGIALELIKNLVHWLEILNIWPYKTFITSQFNYCPLIWMINDRKLNHKISNIYETALLRIVYSDHKTSFSELLKTDKSVIIHQKYLQSFLIEIYDVRKDISPTMNKIFNCLKILSMNVEVMSTY